MSGEECETDSGDKPPPPEAHTGATSKVNCSPKKDKKDEGVKPCSGSSSDVVLSEPTDVYKVLSSLETIFANSICQVLSESSCCGESSGDSTDASHTGEMQRKALLDVHRSNMRELNVKVPEMTHKIAQFFKPIEAYFAVMGQDDFTNRAQDRITALLETVMGNNCTRALLGLSHMNSDTYAKLKQAISNSFLTQYRSVQSLRLLCQCTMTSDKSIKDFVTRLWTYVSRLQHLDQFWLQNLVFSVT